MDDTIRKIKEQITCQSLFKRHYPEHYRSHGNSLCPFHADSADGPSMSVRDDRCHCFGCDQSFDVIDLYQAATGCDKKEAIKTLADYAGIIIPSRKSEKKKGKHESPSQRDPDDAAKRWDYVSKTRPTTPALDYLEGARKLSGVYDELFRTSRIGYSPKFGDHGAFVVPVTTWDGSTILGTQYLPVQGGEKKFSKGCRSSEGFFRYSRGAVDHVILAEAWIDAMSAFVACSASLAVEVVTTFSATGMRQKAKLIDPPPVHPPTIFFDDDPAGIIGTIETLLALGPRKAKCVNWEMAEDCGCNDVNELLKQDRRDLIVKMVEKAIWPNDYESLRDVINGLIGRGFNIVNLNLSRPDISDKDKKAIQLDKTKIESIQERCKNLLEGDNLEGEIKADQEKQGHQNKYMTQEEAVDWLNRNHAFVMLGGKSAILKESVNPYNEEPEVSFWSISDFHHRYSNRATLIETKNDGTKRVPITKIWMQDIGRREYEGVVFAPGRVIDGWYNLFTGFGVQPSPGKWDLIRRHIVEVVASDDPESARYILGWLAHLVQYPGGERPGTALVLKGRQGTGKGIFVEKLLGPIFGRHFRHLTQASHLVGKFNFHLKDALLVFADEAIWAGNKEGESVLKGIVTESLLMVEGKGKDAVTLPNHISLIVASNNDWVIPAGMEDRRFMVVEVSDRYRRNREYFRELTAEIETGGREAMLHDLLQVDLSGVDLRDIPQTEASELQKHLSMDNLRSFWFQILRHGALLFSRDEWGDGEVEVRAFYREYLEYCKEQNERYVHNEVIFGKLIRKLCPPDSISRVRRLMLVMSGLQQERRAWVLHFHQGLKAYQNWFDKLMEKRIDWNS